MVKPSDDSQWWKLAEELVEVDYQQSINGGNTRLAKATREYVRALQETALAYGEKHPGPITPIIMAAYHDYLTDELYDFES